MGLNTRVLFLHADAQESVGLKDYEIGIIAAGSIVGVVIICCTDKLVKKAFGRLSIYRQSALV
jgi:hypothetical protein